MSWAADYPAASDFIDLKLGCTSGLNNEAEFCDPSVQPLIKRAGRLEGSDLHAADRLWARIDHKIVDQAPWVPEVTRTWLNFVSNRVGNVQFHPVWGLLVDQLWVRH